MPYPSNPTKVYLDAGTDSPASARAELAALVDAVIDIIASRGTANGVPSLDSSSRAIAAGAILSGICQATGYNVGSSRTLGIDSTNVSNKCDFTSQILMAAGLFFGSAGGATNLPMLFNCIYDPVDARNEYAVNTGSKFAGQVIFEDATGDLVFYITASAGTNGSAATLVERLRIKSDGKVLIDGKIEVFKSATDEYRLRLGSGSSDPRIVMYGPTHATTPDRIALAASSRIDIAGGAKFNIASIPTSSAGLSSGDIWSNSGVLTIVP